MLGLENTDATICFKWADNADLSDGDILNLYTQGDAAPTGRFTYVYRTHE